MVSESQPQKKRLMKAEPSNTESIRGTSSWHRCPSRCRVPRDAPGAWPSAYSKESPRDTKARRSCATMPGNLARPSIPCLRKGSAPEASIATEGLRCDRNPARDADPEHRHTPSKMGNAERNDRWPERTGDVLAARDKSDRLPTTLIEPVADVDDKRDIDGPCTKNTEQEPHVRSRVAPARRGRRLRAHCRA